MDIIFDNGPLDGGSAFARPHDVLVAHQMDEVPAVLAAMEAARSAGHWLAGMASYELGYMFSNKLRDLMPDGRRLPLLQFGVFDAPKVCSGPPPMGTTPTITAPEPVWGFDRYAAAMVTLKDYIAAGDVYQANFTFPMTAQMTGHPADLYAALKTRQPVGHGVYVDLGDDVLLSRSPELFFEVNGSGQITTRPMKGTMPRGASPQMDHANKNWLMSSAKDRAENLMIVDLLRNDVGRLAEIGSVKVPKLFSIETYETVHQMTSEVRAQLRPDLTVTDLFSALFPCGSITGAPKIRAMQIIAELEDAPRDAYCGAIGWLSPDGPMGFNVAIRTLLVGKGGDVRLNVGGGIVYDSTAEAEYEEALWKARFATLTPTT
ncbi:MAG: aminodeoxychorismate synthase component I [Yoonia sp.]|jgi:para-aminobenzoate synthetase component 1|nr:aminodeoxychorismate synthase component I [Yoonia sp.]